jgi:hypothetical protein
MDIRIEWHSPDQMFAATFLRPMASSQGRPVMEPWYLEGALVGMGSTRSEAVADLISIADLLVTEGENFLTNGPISLEDRTWLFKLLDEGSTSDAEDMQARYEAMRNAGMGPLSQP